MKINIAICTWNRDTLLQKTLERLCHIIVPEGISWELIIINNNSTDNTDNVIEQFKADLPIKRYFEGEPGLSNARNKAIDMATGDYIIWTDDDVLVDDRWLAAYVDAFLRYPEAAVFGGPISPWFEGIPPKWLNDNWHYIQASYAIRELGHTEFPLKSFEPSRFPYGANFAIKKDVQQQFRFDPDLGLKAGKIIVGEETTVIQSILASGETGWWIPDAKVTHWLPKKRQTLSYIMKYYWGLGKTEALKIDPKKDRCLLGCPLWLFRQLLTNITMLSLLFLTLNNRWIVYFRRFWKTVGKIEGCLVNTFDWLHEF
nr:glycosyltransferase [uncultured Desulfobacter sp.]